MVKVKSVRDVLPSKENVQAVTKKFEASKWAKMVVVGVVVAISSFVILFNMNEVSISADKAKIITAFDNVSDIKSGKLSLDIRVTSAKTGYIPTKITGSVLFNTEGSSVLNINAKNGALNFGLGAAMSQKALFIRLQGLSKAINKLVTDSSLRIVLNNTLSRYDDAWIGIPSNAAENTNTAEAESIANDIDPSTWFEAEKLDSTKTLGTSTLTGYRLLIDVGEINSATKKLSSASSGLLESATGLTTDQAEFDGSISSMSQEDLKDVQIVLWTDGTFPRQLTMTSGETAQTAAAQLTITLSDINTPQTVKIPKADFSFEEVVATVLGAFLGSSTQQ